MSNQIKSLQEAINTPAGEYISGGFQAVVTQAKSVPTRGGKTVHKAILTEGVLKVFATSWTTSFAPCEGKLMKWVGMGLKRENDYNGSAQVTIGDKARWIPIGEAPAASEPQPAQQATANTGTKPPPINGQTVGMCIKGAIDLGAKDEGEIWTTASMLMRVSDKLNRGELAPEQQDENVPY